ncbi:MAG: MbnP family protein, partial [Saprospiraceae bacterium]
MKISRPFNILGLVAFLFAGTMFLTSCGKDPDPVPNTGAGTFEFHLHNYVGDNEVEDYGTIYTDDAGRKISLDLAQLYLSHIQLVRPDGSIYEVSDFKILKKQESDVYTLSKVPAGDYKTVRFRLGFDATDNQKAASTDATLLDHPEMWFGASPQPDGYVFLHVRGKVDPTKDATGTEAQMAPFDYKIGTASNYLQVILP